MDSILEAVLYLLADTSGFEVNFDFWFEAFILRNRCNNEPP
jgi:hypothetical protein